MFHGAVGYSCPLLACFRSLRSIPAVGQRQCENLARAGDLSCAIVAARDDRQIARIGSIPPESSEVPSSLASRARYRRPVTTI